MNITTELEIDKERWEAFLMLARVIVEWERSDHPVLTFVPSVQAILMVERKFAFAIVSNLGYEPSATEAVCFAYQRLYKSPARLKVV